MRRRRWSLLLMLAPCNLCLIVPDPGPDPRLASLTDVSYVHKWCAPTRSALMTGRNPMHTGLDPLNWTSTINKRGGDSALSADYIFIPRLLQSAGYESHMLGKVCLPQRSA